MTDKDDSDRIKEESPKELAKLSTDGAKKVDKGPQLAIACQICGGIMKNMGPMTTETMMEDMDGIWMFSCRNGRHASMKIAKKTDGTMFVAGQTPGDADHEILRSMGGVSEDESHGYYYDRYFDEAYWNDE